MEHVTGIGGLFFRAQEPEGLNAWYAEHLGVSGGPDTDVTWRQEAAARTGPILMTKASPPSMRCGPIVNGLVGMVDRMEATP